MRFWKYLSVILRKLRASRAPLTLALRAQDAEQIAEIYRPYVTDTAIPFETIAPDSQEISQRIQETLPKFPWLVCESHNQINGYAYAGMGGHQRQGCIGMPTDTGRPPGKFQRPKARIEGGLIGVVLK